MKQFTCGRCGSRELIDEGRYVVCAYCQSRFVPEADDVPTRGTVIGVAADIEALLVKCRQDPLNRRRYAGLVLDLDPTNTEARQYL